MSRGCNRATDHYNLMPVPSVIKRNDIKGYLRIILNVLGLGRMRASYLLSYCVKVGKFGLAWAGRFSHAPTDLSINPRRDRYASLQVVRDKVGTVAGTVILRRRISYRRITSIRTVLHTVFVPCIN